MHAHAPPGDLPSAALPANHTQNANDPKFSRAPPDRQSSHTFPPSTALRSLSRPYRSDPETNLSLPTPTASLDQTEKLKVQKTCLTKIKTTSPRDPSSPPAFRP